MNKSFRLLAVVAITAAHFLLSNSAVAANLVVNGSFETRDLSGWTLWGGSTVVRSDYGATDGAYAAILGFGNFPGPSFDLSQSFSVLAGKTYKVDFDWAPSPNNLPQSSVLAVEGVSGGVLSTQNLSGIGAFPTPFSHYSLSFVADGATATLRFYDTSPSSYIIDQVIDNVSVEHIANPVPEPETYAMLLAGLGLLGFTARRRNGASRQAA